MAAGVPKARRRLAAILAAGVVGSARPMAAGEAAAMNRLRLGVAEPALAAARDGTTDAPDAARRRPGRVSRRGAAALPPRSGP
jgi:hypothetical protein